MGAHIHGQRHKLPPEARHILKLTQEEFVLTTCRLFRLSPQEIVDEVNYPTTESLTALLGTMIVKAIDEGDERRAQFLFERTIGKVPDKVQEDIPPTIEIVCD